MKIKYVIWLVLVGLIGCKSKNHSGRNKTDVEFWLTSTESNILFKKQNMRLVFEKERINNQIILVDTAKIYQTIDGFGNCLTGGSAMHLFKMGVANRAALLKELFGTENNNIGISYLRVSIGASDLDEKVFSYDDLPKGETDLELAKFDLGYDKLYLIPILKEILAINPEIKILGSPWSAPTWMKTNADTRGGSLNPRYFDAYARYFVKYIQAMKAEGIYIDAITIQNEPLHPGNNPSMCMTAQDQALFIKKSLGPVFVSNAVNTKIIVYDHNADRPDYPLTILKDSDAAQYVDGSAFHLYGGNIDTLSVVHNAFPNKNLYFTEQWVGAPGNLSEELIWHIRTLIIGGTRNWCRSVLEWNMASDSNYKPHTDRGGCETCMGTVTIDGNTVIRNPAYYILAHSAKFVRPGSVRIESNVPSNLPNFAFLTPSGQKVLIVLNDANGSQTFNICFKGKYVSATLDKGAVGTFVW